MNKTGNPRRSKRQMGLDATPINGSTRKGNKKPQNTVAQGSLRQMVREEASRKRQRPSAQVRITEIGDLQDEDPDAWRYVEDPEDELEKEEADNDIENSEEAEAEAEEAADKESDAEEEVDKEADAVEPELEVEKEQEECLTDQSKNKKRRTRGPTKMNKVAKRHEEKVEVQFNSFGEPVGKGSVTLSSFLGPLVREYVPVLVDDWRHVDERAKDTMWEEVQVQVLLLLTNLMHHFFIFYLTI